MSNVANKKRIADDTLSLLKSDTVLAAKTGVATVHKPNSYDRTMVLTVKKVGLVGGVRSLIDNNTKIDSGVSSFDNKWLPKGETVIINGITVLGSSDATATVSPANASFTSTRANIENALRSANFRVVQGKTMFEAPIDRIAPNGVVTNNDDLFVPLVKPITLLPETAFNFELETASDADPLSVTDGYLKFMFDVTVISTNNARQDC